MKKYLITITITLIFMLCGITAITVKLFATEYSPNINVTVETKPTSQGATTSYTVSNTDVGIVSSEPYVSYTDAVSTEISEKTVYITPYGLKYHNRRTCAGKNATVINLVSAEKTFEPCAKCIN